MFPDAELFPTHDPRLLRLFSASTMAGWRSAGVGPEFIKCGRRIFYSGRALNAFLESRTVRTANSGLAHGNGDDDLNGC